MLVRRLESMSKQLSPRELEVLKLLAVGYTTKEITGVIIKLTKKDKKLLEELVIYLRDELNFSVVSSKDEIIIRW